MHEWLVILSRGVIASSLLMAPTAAVSTPPDMLVAWDAEILVSDGVGARRVVLLTDLHAEPFAFEVRRPGDNSLLQVVTLKTQGPPPGPQSQGLRATDLNGDGHADLMLLSWSGATGNRGYLAWRYDATIDAFVAIPDFDALSRPEVEPGGACIRSWSRGGSAGAEYVKERWCWHERALRLEWSEQQRFVEASDAITCVRRALRAGEMVEIESADVSCEILDAVNAALKAAPSGER